MKGVGPDMHNSKWDKITELSKILRKYTIHARMHVYQMGTVRLVPNQSKNGKYNLISV